MPKSKSMSRVPGRRRSKRHLSVRGVLLREPDLEKVADTVAALAIAQAEKAAQDAHRRKRRGQS